MAEPASLDTPTFRPFPALAEAWLEPIPGERLEKLRKAALHVREQLLTDGPVAAVETCPFITFPYPALFAFGGMASTSLPFIMMTNRMQVVQFEQGGRLRTMLFNPTDTDRAQNAPFFARLRKRYGFLGADKLLAKKYGTVQSHLERLGLQPGDVDYIAFDHMHTQDVRGWLGGEGVATPFFPRAKILVQRREWAVYTRLHPLQEPWFVKDGIAGVPADRVVFLDGDAWLGKGVALISTPGHTWGNMSLAVVTGTGIAVANENGVATECYTPDKCGISGVRSSARFYGQEVVLNGNTREGSLDQYSSMVVEKTIAGPAPDAPEYVNFHPSSELTASIFAPGLKPTLRLAAPKHGQIRKLRVA
jgi:hypothetical protein